MSREISEDFSELVNFLNGYDLNGLTENADFVTILSQQHKKYFAYLTFIAELTEMSGGKATEPKISKKQLSFLTESCSDIGSSIFVMSHGAYKASRMMLRSSIETFNKGFCLDDIPNIDTVKSVYNIFDMIKNLEFFKEEPNKGNLELLHQGYKILCQDTHTATTMNMANITALNYFPRFDLHEASQLANISVGLVSAYNTLLAIKFNSYFHKMHHRNKENIMGSIKKQYRPIIQGIL